jgi:eukaryotic-like serine/threonine-protein kinase
VTVELAKDLDDDSDDIARLAHARLGSVVSNKWTLEAILGIGGMGTVYRARHRNGSQVAIKMMHQEHASNSKHSARFFREAVFANRIEHPAVLRVFDDGTTETGCPYLVTELLTGENLEDERVAAGGVLTLGAVITTAFTVLDVLEKAHAAGLIHRDLKPLNLFRTSTGDLKVLDFGIGRDLHEKSNAPGKLTSAFVAMGTVGFMAPEQAKGKMNDVNASTDLWALGASMLMLATSLETHEADSPIAALGLAAVQPVAKTATRVRLMPQMCDFLDKAMAYHQAERFQSAAEMRTALERVHDALGAKAATRIDVRASKPAIAPNDSFLGVITARTDDNAVTQHNVKAGWSIRTKKLAVVAIASGAGIAGIALLAAVGIQRYREQSAYIEPASGAQPAKSIKEESPPAMTLSAPASIATPAVTPSARPDIELPPTVTSSVGAQTTKPAVVKTPHAVIPPPAPHTSASATVPATAASPTATYSLSNPALDTRDIPKR